MQFEKEPNLVACWRQLAWTWLCSVSEPRAVQNWEKKAALLSSIPSVTSNNKLFSSSQQMNKYHNPKYESYSNQFWVEWKLICTHCLAFIFWNLIQEAIRGLVTCARHILDPNTLFSFTIKKKKIRIRACPPRDKWLPT